MRVIFMLILLVSLPAYSQPGPASLDATSWNLAERPLSLATTWTWHDFELIGPGEAGQLEGKSIQLPGTWNHHRPGAGGLGYATYVLRVQLPEQPALYELKMPHAYCSYRLWVEGELVGTNGAVGLTEDTAKPEWRPRVLPLGERHGTVELVLQVANFHHFIGGLKSAPELAQAPYLQKRYNQEYFAAHVEGSLIGLVALSGLVLFLLRDRKKVSLYFALLAITWGVRIFVSNEYFIHAHLSLPWKWLVRVEYLTIYLSMIWAILFVARLFIEEVNQYLKYGLIIINTSFTAFTLLAEPLLFTRWINVYLFVSGIILLYATIIIVRALLNDRLGSGFLSISMLLTIIVFCLDIASYKGAIPHVNILFSLGYAAVFALMGLGLLVHLGMVKSAAKPEAKLKFDDFFPER